MAARLLQAAVVLSALLMVASARKLSAYETVVPIEYTKIVDTGDVIGKSTYGLILNKQMKPVFTTGADGMPTSTPLVGNNPDMTTLIQLPGNKLFMVTQFEAPRPAISYVTELSQSVDGTLTPINMTPVDWSSEHGLWIPCSGSKTPWNTHMTGEEYEPDARPLSEARTLTELKAKQGDWGSVEQFMAYFGIYKAQITLQNVQANFNPYRYGHIAETRVNPDGSSKVTKHYTLGRASWELAKVMPDLKTVYGTDDGTNVGFYKFVADRPSDLSSGWLYAAKMTQTDAANGGSFTITWIPLGHGVNSHLKKLAESVKFRNIFETAPFSATNGCPAGFKSINTGVGAECLKLRNNMAIAAAFLETRRYAAFLGATTEFSKWEGLTIDIKRNMLYTAMSDVRYGMEDNKRRGSADTRYDRGGPNSVAVEYNKCGCVYKLSLDAKYNAKDMSPLVCGIPISTDPANQCHLDGISNPDNVWMMDDLDTLLIAEDSDYHANNALWAYDLKTNKMERLLTVQPDAEVGHTSYYPMFGAKNFTYLVASNQHPAGGAPATSGYFTWPASATTGKVDVSFDSISVPVGDEGDVIRGTTKMTVTRK